MSTNYHKVYEYLGYLFYAVAVSEGFVSTTYRQRLKLLIGQFWAPQEGTVDEHATDAAHYIFAVFDRLVSDQTPGEDAFSTFETFYNKNADAFSSTIKHRISDTTGTIAHAFGAINDSAFEYQTRLHALLTDDTLVNQVHG